MSLTRKDVRWSWNTEHQNAFDKLKSKLCRNELLAHYDINERIGISCDASNVGLRVVYFTDIKIKANVLYQMLAKY